MELTELVSTHVAVPVIGVVLCVFMVFAFGFRSTVQPPVFNFEEEKKNKRRVKHSKVKVATVSDNIPTDATKSVLLPTREHKATTSPKAKSHEVKAEVKNEVNIDHKGEKKVKAKRETGKEDVKAESAKKSKTVLVKRAKEEDGEWTTIQVSKKGKKQKSSSKMDGVRAESAMGSENEPETPAPVTEAAAASPAPDIEEPSSPQVTRGKNKTPKHKVAEKLEAEVTKDFVQTSPAIEPVTSTSLKSHVEDLTEGKRKKNKKDKKVASEAAAASSEKLPQDAAPASGKVVNEEPALVLPVVSVKDPVSIEPHKSTPKKKKPARKENLQEKVSEEDSNIQISQPEKPVESVRKPSDSKKIDAASEAIVEEPLKTLPQAILPTTAPAHSSTGVSFDEIGDLWQEKAPKTKKKKARRDN